MKVARFEPRSRLQKAASGFALAEALIATLAAAVMLLALYASFTFGFAAMRVTREDVRATQILVQRMEAVRLSPYETLTNSALFPTNVTVYFDETGTSTNHGTTYTVSFTAATGPGGLPATYKTNMMLVTVTATWNSGSMQRSRAMQSYVSQYGIQHYVAGY